MSNNKSHVGFAIFAVDKFSKHKTNIGKNKYYFEHLPLFYQWKCLLTALTLLYFNNLIYKGMLPKVWIHLYLLYFLVSLWKAYYKLDRLVSTSICLPYLKLLLLTLILFVIVLTVNNMGPIVLLTFEITNSGAIILCYLWGSFMKFNKKLVQYRSIVKCLSSCIFASILALSSSFTTEGWPNDSLS